MWLREALLSAALPWDFPEKGPAKPYRTLSPTPSFSFLLQNLFKAERGEELPQNRQTACPVYKVKWLRSGLCAMNNIAFEHLYTHKHNAKGFINSWPKKTPHAISFCWKSMQEGFTRKKHNQVPEHWVLRLMSVAQSRKNNKEWLLFFLKRKT